MGRFDMDGVSVSVVDYFRRTYNYEIKFPGLPAIESGTRERKRYLPMEVFIIFEQQSLKYVVIFTVVYCMGRFVK